MELRVPPPVVALISAATMWLVAEQLTYFGLEIPLRGLLSLVLLVVGLAVELSAVLLFLEARTTVNPMRPRNTARLVEHGIYRVTRNPMYLGVLLLLAAWAVWLGNPLNIAVLALFAWYVTRFQIIPEERILRALFAESYESYCSRVRRWL